MDLFSQIYKLVGLRPAVLNGERSVRRRRSLRHKIWRIDR
jgi:hypothetical protein